MVCAHCGQETGPDAKFCRSCGAPLDGAEPARELRKVVSVVFCDLTGSTELGERLDAEALRALLSRYFERMRAIVERHGGSVEKFIGDAVMAVFGVPAAHEDDALRAARTAVAMRDALPVLGLRGRIGVMTGEVVTGTAERLVTGDAVNVAARLEQAAPVGQVLIGEPTMARLGGAAEVEMVEPLDLKGKAEPITAYRLVSVGDAPGRAMGGPFVGRRPELEFLLAAWERVRSAQRCELVTVVGEAGIGKSRLAAEFLASVDATVIRGRCPPYGEGITYWPVVEVLKQLQTLPADAAAVAAIRSLLGETEQAASAEETAWAVRKTLETSAAAHPLVVVFDDIQWGEQTFLDLIEHVALLSSGAPMLLLCMARPELSERRPAWPVAMRLEPLAEQDVDRLFPSRIPEQLRKRIALIAAGNPLFVSEMVPIADEAAGEVIVPETLRALLAARLDQLDEAERSVLERGSIEGEIFHRGAVQALADDDAAVTPRLAELVRKQLIQPDRSPLAGEDGFRFRHLLIRDAAYDALSKSARADLHRRYAAWLDQKGLALVERDELVGYHLEQACGYRASLGMPRDAELAAEARRRLTDSARRAQQRADSVAASGLLERAAGLAPPGEIDLALESDLIDALFSSGQADAAVARAQTLIGRASAAGDRAAELCGGILVGIVEISTSPEGAATRLAALVEQAQPAFEAAGDDLGLSHAWHARAQVEFERARTDAALDAYEHAAIHARRAGMQQEFLDWRALCRFYGSTPVAELLAWLDEHEPQLGWDHWGMRACRAHARSMTGDLEGARALIAEARAALSDRGGSLGLGVVTAIESVMIERLAERPAAAAELGAEGCRQLEQLGDQGFLSSAAAELAEALYQLGRDDEAAAWCDRSAELGASEDLFTQMGWRQAKAKLLGRAGRHDEAERMARDAVSIGLKTDYVNGQANALHSLAEVLTLGGRAADAVPVLEEAVTLYQRKGNLVMVDRVRAQLATRS